MVNGVVYAKDNKAEIFSIENIVVTEYFSSIMAGVDISVKFSVYERLEEFKGV